MFRASQFRPYTLGDVAAALDAPVVGDPALPVRDLVHPREARDEADLVFIMDPTLLAALAGTPVRCAVVAQEIAVPPGQFAGHIPVPRPRYALATLLDLFARPVHAPAGVHPSAFVDASAELGPRVSVGAFTYVGPGATVGPGTVLMPHVTVGAEARIGADCLLHPGVRVGERVVLGNRVIVHHNASIGADGFSYATPDAASFETARGGGDVVETPIRGLRRINSIGTVVIGDDVEIGACAAIDRANIGATTIGRGTKIDNLVQVGHNCTIGEDCLISGQTGISGSCRIGNRVVLAGGVGVADHITIGDDAVVGARSGVGRHVPPRQVVIGLPATAKTKFIERELNVGRIGRLIRDLADLRRRLARLESR